MVADGGVNSRYDGSGGVNKVFLGASYKISLSLVLVRMYIIILVQFKRQDWYS
jgi:hypothetical protein